MEISLKNIIIWLLLPLAVLVLLNVFVIMPFLSMKPVQIVSSQEEVAEIIEPATVVTLDSLAIIRKGGGAQRVISTYPANENLRNPFFWPEEKSRQEKINLTTAEKPEPEKPEIKKPEPEKPQLSMVIIGMGRKQALLGDVFVKEGDSYHGYMVKRIEENKVILSDDFGEVSIFLTTAAAEKVQDLPPGGLIER